MVTFKTFKAVGNGGYIIDINQSGLPDEGDLSVTDNGYKPFMPSEDRVETAFIEGGRPYSEEDVGNIFRYKLPILGGVRLQSFKPTISDKFGTFGYGLGKGAVRMPVIMYRIEIPNVNLTD